MFGIPTAVEMVVMDILQLPYQERHSLRVDVWVRRDPVEDQPRELLRRSLAIVFRPGDLPLREVCVTPVSRWVGRQNFEGCPLFRALPFAHLRK